MEIKIEKLDHLGRGIGYLDGKICFVPFAVIGDIIDIAVVKEHKNFIEAKINKIVKRSPLRIDNLCPYFEKCGGCQLLNINYENTLEYKLERVKDILSKFNYKKEITIVRSDEPLYYRNKIELKINNGRVGFYQNKTNDVIEIEKCIVARSSLNEGIKLIKSFNIINGNVTLRCNYNDELLIIIDSKDKVHVDEALLPKYKVVGIILNDKIVYGENHYLDKINDNFFEVSYDSFFQINSNINEKLCDYVSDNAYGNALDLYCGVGSLGLSTKKCEKVIGIEVIHNAIINALKNKKINKRDNIEFILGKVEDKIKYINEKIDTIIVDPPRKGLDNITINTILEINPNRIIYISCDTFSLAKNLDVLKEKYTISEIKLFDMFPYTYHTETVCILEKK